jgi:Protein of unknown function (DUF1552)
MKNSLSRRAVLRGTGVAIALPFLPSLLPRGARAAGPELKRFVSLMHSDGVLPSTFYPTRTGANFDITESLKPLQTAGVLSEIDLITGMTHPTREHGNCAFSLMLGKEDYNNPVDSVDVAIFKKVGANIGLKRRLTLSTTDHAQSALKQSNIVGGFVDSAGEEILKRTGYVEKHFAFSGSFDNGTVQEPEYNPARVFNMLFCGGPATNCPGGGVVGGGGGGGPAIDPKMKHRKSVLSSVTKQAKALQAKLGVNDRARLDEYLTGIQDLESRLVTTTVPNPGGGTVSVPSKMLFRGIPESQNAWGALMIDLIVKAFEANLVSVASLMLGHSLGQDLPTDVSCYRWNSVTGGTGSYVSHYASHNTGNDPMVQTTVVQAKLSMLGRLVKALSATSDGQGSDLLKGTLVYYVSDFGDGGGHKPDSAPILLAGRSSGLVRGNTHRILSGSTAQVLVSLASAFGTSMPHLAGTQGVL